MGLFTAAGQNQANAILDHIDPQGKYFQHRYYYQHTCNLDDLKGGNLQIKDLEIFTAGEVKLENILLIDNNIYSFALHLENGIPIQHFFGDQTDQCLLHVIQYLKHIKDFDNLAAENERIYGFRKMFNGDVPEFIDYYFSDNNTSRQENVTLLEKSSEILETKSENVLLGSDANWNEDGNTIFSGLHNQMSDNDRKGSNKTNHDLDPPMPRNSIDKV